LLLEAQALSFDRVQVLSIVLGTVFVFAGLLACGIAAVRGRGGVRMLVWFGIFNLMYGTRILLRAPAFVTALPVAAGQKGPAGPPLRRSRSI
jgi:hypothetical protein